jgi:hypothetical protein
VILVLFRLGCDGQTSGGAEPSAAGDVTGVINAAGDGIPSGPASSEPVPQDGVTLSVPPPEDRGEAPSEVNPQTEPGQVQTLLGETGGIAFVGDWTSPACGGRGYARNVYFASTNEYAVIELVSPCPVGATCVWSGMSTFAGTWRLDGNKLRVQEVGLTSMPEGGPHPVLFEGTSDGTLVENGCTYTRGLTVPPGYDENRVRPKIPGT